MSRLLLAHIVDDMIYFGFKVGHPSAIVQDEGNDNSDKHYGQYQTPSQSGVRGIIFLVDLCFGKRFVALFSSVSVTADASLSRVTHEVTGTGAVARFHTVIAVEAFRTYLVAAISHPTGKADALSVVLPALGVVLATALLATVWPVESVGTHRFTVGPGPSRRTLTHARFMRTFATIFAGTLQTTLRPVGIRRAGMFTRGSDVARSAGVLSGYVIAGRIAMHRPRATFLTAMTKESIRTGFIAISTSPAP